MTVALIGVTSFLSFEGTYVGVIWAGSYTKATSATYILIFMCFAIASWNFSIKYLEASISLRRQLDAKIRSANDQPDQSVKRDYSKRDQYIYWTVLIAAVVTLVIL